MKSKELTQQQFLALKAAFIIQGTSFAAWCKANGFKSTNAKGALLGVYAGPKSQEIINKAIQDSKVQLFEDDKTNSQKALDNVLNILKELTINDAEYVLKATAQTLSQKFTLNGVIKFPVKSKIQRDLPLLNFILSLELNYLSQKDVRALCIDKFGTDRVPARTSFNREWPHLVALKAERDHEI